MKIDQALTKYGAYISAFVLLIWTIKFLVFTVTMTLMMMQEGVTGALALFFSPSVVQFIGETELENSARRTSHQDPTARIMKNLHSCLHLLQPLLQQQITIIQIDM